MDKIYDISDDYDSIYNEDMRDRILEEYNNNKEEEREEDEELENDI